MNSPENTALASATRSLPFTGLRLFLHLVWIGLLIIGIIYAYGSWQLTTQGASTTGTVVNMNQSQEDDGSYTFAPTVQYQVDGNPYRYQSHNYSNPPAYQVGQTVSLVYQKDHPEQARISNFVELWLLPLIVIPMAVGTAALTFFFTSLFMRRRKA